MSRTIWPRGSWGGPSATARVAARNWRIASRTSLRAKNRSPPPELVADPGRGQGLLVRFRLAVGAEQDGYLTGFDTAVEQLLNSACHHSCLGFVVRALHEPRFRTRGRWATSLRGEAHAASATGPPLRREPRRSLANFTTCGGVDL